MRLALPSALPIRPIDATLSVTKAARLLGVHPNTVRAWSDAGRLRYYRINPRGDRRYRLGDLQRFLTAAENALIGAKLSEYHTGYRAYSRELLERLPLDENSDDFVFDNQVLAQIHWLGYVIAEVTCPTKYFPEGSSISFRRSVRYGLGCLKTGLQYRLAKAGIVQSRLFPVPR